MSGQGSQNLDDLYRAIVEVHNEAKGLFLLAEETEPHRFRSFLQPSNELRHAYEHAIRAKANEFGQDKGPVDPDYQNRSLKRTLGHEYRAFFDWADWLSVILRERIQNTLKPYNNACIVEVLPDYYPTIKPRIMEISKSIAKIRGDKDIARREEEEPSPDEIEKDPAVLSEIREYKKMVAELWDIHKKMIKAVPSLEEYRQKKEREWWKNWRWTVIGTIIATIVGGVLLCFALGRWVAPAESGLRDAVHERRQ